MAGRLMKRNGFTLIELMVVIAMIAILTAAVGGGVAKARARARISRAETEANEMTNAIRAYENYVDTALKEMRDEEATLSSISFLLGEGKDRNGNDIPVLYNANATGSEIRDPWGNPYLIRIEAASANSGNNDGVASSLRTGVYIPNRYRPNRRKGK